MNTSSLSSTETGSAQPLEFFRTAYRDRELEARARHARGERIVGYFSNNIPVELISASGMFPLQLTGSPDDSTEVGDAYMEDFFDGFIRSIFNRMLTGRFDFVDLIVVPRTSESYLQLYYFLHEMGRWEPSRPFPELYLFDLLQTNNWLTGRYVRGRFDDFKGKLEQVSGRTIDEAAMVAAIGNANRNRALLAQVNQLRRQHPPRLCGSDMLRVISSSTFVDVDAHSGMLEVLLANTEKLPVLNGPRVMVKGSPLDNSALYELIESCGAVVVADDQVFGERVFEHLVREPSRAVNALEVLTEHYQLHSVGPRQYPQERQDRIFIELVEAADVQGVVFYVEEYDDVLGWDYPQQKKLLDQRGIPSMYLKRQSYRNPDEAAQRTAVTGFIESLVQATVEV